MLHDHAETFGLVGPAIFFLALLIVLPVLLALLVTWGHRRAVRLSCALWYGGLALVFLLEAIGGSAGGAAYMTLTYGFFFSVAAVPVLALLIRVILALRRRASTDRSAP